MIEMTATRLHVLRRCWIPVLLGLVMLLPACGGDDNRGGHPMTPPTSPPPSPFVEYSERREGPSSRWEIRPSPAAASTTQGSSTSASFESCITIPRCKNSRG